MTLRLEHLVIPARDQERSARFLADLLGLQVTGESSGSPAAHFAVVRVKATDPSRPRVAYRLCHGG